MSNRARKRFGQHFLVAPDVISDIVEAIAPQTDDDIVEIGPGRGAITLPLANSGASINAIEFDRDLVSLLSTKLANYDNVMVHEADALRFDYANLGEELRIVGNLPYNISTPLLFHLLHYLSAIRDMVFMLQKEVVDRITATPGNRSYGRLTIMLGCHVDAYPLFDVPPDAFAPPPKVMSSVVALRPIEDARFQVRDPRSLSALVAAAFSKRRKTMRNALKGVVDVATLEAIGIDPGSRPEQIAIEQWVKMSNTLA